MPSLCLRFFIWQWRRVSVTWSEGHNACDIHDQALGLNEHKY